MPCYHDSDYDVPPSAILALQITRTASYSCLNEEVLTQPEQVPEEEADGPASPPPQVHEQLSKKIADAVRMQGPLTSLSVSSPLSQSPSLFFLAYPLSKPHFRPTFSRPVVPSP